MIAVWRIVRGVHTVMATVGDHRTGVQLGALLSITGLIGLVAWNTRRIAEDRHECASMRREIDHLTTVAVHVNTEMECRQIGRELWIQNDDRIRRVLKPQRGRVNGVD